MPMRLGRTQKRALRIESGFEEQKVRVDEATRICQEFAWHYRTCSRGRPELKLSSSVEGVLGAQRVNKLQALSPQQRLDQKENDVKLALRERSQGYRTARGVRA